LTPKLFNTTTRSIKVKIETGKPRAPSKPEKRERKPREKERKYLQAKCPHLHSHKTCAMMVKDGLDGNVSEFDIKHFCDGNPLLCYYFRMSSRKEKK